MIGETILFFFNQFGQRVKRLFVHITHFKPEPTKYVFYSQDALTWFIDLIIKIMDVFGIPEWYEVFFILIKPNLRLMTNEEKAMAHQIFGNSIDYSVIKIDDKARIGTKRWAIAYVSFNTINYRNSIDDETLIHELAHIWQFQNYGSIYINRAIKAQKSREGYDYGGSKVLYQAMIKGKRLLEYNVEQQADIIEHYYALLKHSHNLHTSMELTSYQYFADQLLIKNAPPLKKR